MPKPYVTCRKSEHLDVAAEHELNSYDAPEQSGLARATWPEQTGYAASFDVRVDCVQDLDLAPPYPQLPNAHRNGHWFALLQYFNAC